MALEQEGFRWRNDDGSETTATWADSQDTNISLALDTPVRLRFAIDVNTGPSGAAKYRLEYKKSTDSQWIGIMPEGTSGHAVTLALSSNITAGGEATTAQLTAPSGKTTGDFAAGRMWDDENGDDEQADIPASDYTELEWCVQAVSGEAAPSDIYQFRVTREITAPAGPTVFWDSGELSGVTLSNSDLTVNWGTGYSIGGVRANTALSGKVYFRIELTDTGDESTAFFNVGIIAGTAYTTNLPPTYSAMIIDDMLALLDGYVDGSGGTYFSGIGATTEGQKVDVAVDIPNNKIWFRANGAGNWNSSATADPETNTEGATITTGQTYYPFVQGYGGDGVQACTGVFADDSSGSCPSGFSWLDS